MLEIGDEVISCEFGGINAGRLHSHLDACFEVRTILDVDTIFQATKVTKVTGLFSSAFCHIDKLTLAPTSLLFRKTEFYGRMTKIIRNQDVREQASSGAVLDRLGEELDRYTFCDESALRIWRTTDSGDRSSRMALDGALHYILEHRRDHGLGRDRYHILTDVIVHLNAGPITDKLVF